MLRMASWEKKPRSFRVGPRGQSGRLDLAGLCKGLQKNGHNPECRAWIWLAKTSGELLTLYRCVGYAARTGANEEASCQEKQAQGLRRVVRKGLWQEKSVKEDVRQLWVVVAKSLGRQQWARESEWGLLEDVWQVAERWAQKFEAEALLAKKKAAGTKARASCTGQCR